MDQVYLGLRQLNWNISFMNDVNIITSDFCFVHDTEPPGGVQLPRIEEDICIDGALVGSA